MNIKHSDHQIAGNAKRQTVNESLFQIKFCGIMSADDGALSVESGATHIGLIFVDGSPRNVSLPQARLIRQALGREAQIVAVFKDAPASFIDETIRLVQPDFVQLHGLETPEYCRQQKVPVIKAFELGPDFDFGKLAAYGKSCRYFLFDRPKTLPASDHWLQFAIECLRTRYHELPPFFMAGGLSPENVGAVIHRLSPFGVDVASGIESQPGVKNMTKMRQFIAAVKGEKFDA